MKKISLYIHIPFCDQKCYYCDFPSFAGKGNLKDSYIDALIKEIKLTPKNKIIDTIFIGGGTPSSLSENQLERLLSEIKKFLFDGKIEYTVECNPGSITEKKLNIMKKYGVNRISMGLQAIQNSLLKDIGRIHNFEVFKENFRLARECGFTNINVDLMFALPKQSIKQWKETLESIIKLNPEHISAYSLIIEEGTKFYNLNENKKLKLPSEDEEREMYHLTKNILNDYGYNQYEISNYSKSGLECRHNIIYWEMKNWIGLGSAASSHIDGERFTNYSSVEKYIECMKSGVSAKEEVHVNMEYENIEEFMFMGLRLVKGISEDDFEKRFGKSIDEIYKNKIDKFVLLGLLIRENRKIYFTEKGMEYSNNVMSEMLL
ncbi:MAG: radical SAM family heme chaperone HemW [Sarcina sp.]